MGKTFTLTRKANIFKGSADADTFTAPLTAKGKSTLGARDLLDGGKGVDAITATLSGASLTPALRRIETGTFTYGLLDAQTLDLAKAKSLKTMTLIDSDSSANAASVTLKNAGKLSNLTIRNDNATSFGIGGLSDTAAAALSLTLDNVNASSVSLATKSGKAFGTIDLTLANAVNATLGGNKLSAETLFVHANGNKPVLSLAAGRTINLLKADGTGELTLAQGSLDRVKAVDASALSGGLTATIGGTVLIALTASAGADTITLNGTGGTAAAKAAIALGDGDDRLTIAAGVDLSTVTIDGGAGTDTLKVTGGLTAPAGSIANVEEIDVTDASGTIDLAGAALAKLTLEGKAQATTIKGLSATTIINAQTLGVPLTATLDTVFASFTGTSGDDYITVAGTPASGLAKAQVNLGTGSDTLTIAAGVDLARLDIDAGAGNDTLSIVGNPAFLSESLAGFEFLTVTDPTGQYDMTGLAVSNITLVGTASAAGITMKGLAQTAGVFAAAAKNLTLTINGDFGTLTTSNQNDSVSLTKPALAAAGSFTIDLLDGLDILTFHYAFNGASMKIGGGGGFKVVNFREGASNINQNVSQFQSMNLWKGSGDYSLPDGMTAVTVMDTPASYLGFSNIKDQTTINLQASINAGLGLSLASGTPKETMVDLTLDNPVGLTIGNILAASGGLAASSVSTLRIEAASGSNSILFNGLGTAGNPAKLYIHGSGNLSLYGAQFSNNIHTIYANDFTGNLNLAGLRPVDFHLGQVEIWGGTGDLDRLYGSNQGDDITSGGGAENFILGRGGIDQITLAAGGNDTIIYEVQSDAQFVAVNATNIERIVGFIPTQDVLDLPFAVQFSAADNVKSSYNQCVASLTGGGKPSAAYDTSSGTLYIDFNGDGSLTTAHDMQIELLDLSSAAITNFSNTLFV